MNDIKIANKADTKKTGIYKITNLANEKVYIGQSVNLWSRINEGHIQKLRKGKSHNKYLQRSWDKYGESSFTFEIIEYAPTNSLDERETYWIDFYNSSSNNFGYNFHSQGSSPMGVKMSLEFRAKISKATKGVNNPFYGRRHSNEAKQEISASRSIPIVQLTSEGDMVKVWRNRKEASEFYKVSPNSIYTVLIGKTYQAKGYVWKYKEDYDKNGYSKEDHFKNKKVPKYMRAVIQLDMDGCYIREFLSAKEAQDETGVSGSSICNACRGRIKSSRGFKWIYKDEYESGRRL